MKSAMCLFLCLNVLIFYLASATLLLLLNAVWTSLIKLSQSQMSSSSSIWSILFCTQILTMLVLSQTNTVLILSSITMTLLLLRNNWILLYQSSNFIQLLSNYCGSGTILFGIIIYAVSLCTVSVDASDISSDTGSIVLFLFEVQSSVILNDPNISSSTSILVVS